MENFIKNHKAFFYLLLIFFAIFSGTGIFITLNTSSKQPTVVNKELSKTVTESVVVSSDPATEGALSLTTIKDKVLSTDREFVVDIIADSNGKNITGYDLALSYDPIAFDFVKATSSRTDFKVYSYNRGNYLSFLVTKLPQSEKTSVFAQTKIISVVFKPNKKGAYNFSLKSEINKDKTDLVTDKTEILNPILSGLEVKVL
ncbi:MAG: hypothetical protein WC744_01865 [Patescibacteria group bacterium]|jgi:hypothetical protein